MRSSVCLTVVLLLRGVALTQTPVNVATEARTLERTLLEKHVQPRTLDDNYSSWVFDHLIDGLDPERMYFSEADIKSLKPLREKIDDELQHTGWNFLPQLTKVYKKSLENYQAGISALAKQRIDVYRDDVYKEDTLRPPDASGLTKKWELEFRCNTLERLVNLQSRYPALSEKEFLAQNEMLARQHVGRIMLRDAERVLHHAGGFEYYVAAEFYKSMAAAFDPHTTYFSAQEMQNFMSSLSTMGYYFGITLGENDRDEVSITQLMPGGPAWKSGEIHIGDVLLTLQWEGQEPVDLWGVDLDEVNDMLTESNHAALTITFRRSDGTQKAVLLRKEKIESDQANVKSFILDGDRKIGYISLPDFYTNWGDDDGSKCASDVAREIIKLKKENIEGLILDLRFNGGGAMVEAVAMAGIFIDAGPVGIVKNRAGELVSVKDMNRGTIYDGPLVILVNGLSASASEFLAAALQDHHRALIVGGNTYGKATAQQIMPVDPKADALKSRALPMGSQPGNISFASITVEKLYRITGKTAQRTGVMPDILLPDALRALPIREANLPRAFAPDSIQKKMYYQPLPALPVKVLREKSAIRVAAQPKFAALDNYSTKIASMDEEEIPLNWNKFKKIHGESVTLANAIEFNSNVARVTFKASRMPGEEQRMQMDSYVNEFNQVWIKNLQEDISLNEAFLIICDYVPLVTLK